LEQIASLFRLLAQLYQQVNEKLAIIQLTWSQLTQVVQQWSKDTSSLKEFLEENKTASPIIKDIIKRITAVKYSYSRLVKLSTNYLLELEKVGLINVSINEILE
jgi:predicted DNA-binding protein YlxM (UPF0122 family)